jgi:hypothetical protein
MKAVICSSSARCAGFARHPPWLLTSYARTVKRCAR